MTTVAYTTGGRTVTIINRSTSTIVFMGRSIAPGSSSTVALRDIQGHPSRMTQLRTLKANGDADIQLVTDLLNDTDLRYLDAPLPSDVYLSRDVWNNVVASDDDAIRAVWTATAAAATYSGSDLDGAYGVQNLDYPRNIAIRGVTGGGEALVEKDVIVTGVDINDQVLQETITVSTGGQGAVNDTTYQGAYAFKRVTSLYFPADGSGSPGEYRVGFGQKLGLSRPLTQGGMIAEFVSNVVAGAGTVALSTVGLPNGTYSPALAPNGARDWVVSYIPS